jgi:hypothetical protein
LHFRLAGRSVGAAPSSRKCLHPYVGEAARAGVFAIWFYLIWRIAHAISGIYGPTSALYLEFTPAWRIVLDVTAAFLLAAFCFAVI